MDLAHPTQIPLEDFHGESVIEELPFQGDLPAWLEGTLIRNGPAKFHFGAQKISHWFDGMALLHAFTFGKGKVSYRNKFLRSDPYLNATKHDDLRFMGFAQDPCKSVFQRLFSYFLPSLTPTIVQNGNVNVMRIAEHYVALTETPLPVRFDPQTLQTYGVFDYQDTLLKKDCFESAHPHFCRYRRETINYQIDLGASCKYTFYSVNEHGPTARKPIIEIKSDKAAYMHTFALTEHYIIMVEFPLVLSPIDLLLKGGGYISQFKWEPQRNTRFQVIDRSDGKVVRTYETEAFFCFHHVNAYEEKDTIVVDLVRYPDPKIVYGDPGPEQVRQLERFRINLKQPSITTQTLMKSSLELPRIYYQKHNTSPYRYVYGVGFQYPETPNASIPILKIDVTKGTQLEWKEAGKLAGEPVFIPLSDGKEEDDGILLSVVIDGNKEHSCLLVLNAKNLQEIARSEPFPYTPYGLHGMFYKK